MNSFRDSGAERAGSPENNSQSPSRVRSAPLRYEHVLTVVPGEQLQLAQHDFR